MVGKQPERNQDDLDNVLAAVGSGLASATMTFIKDAHETQTESEDEDGGQITKPDAEVVTASKDGGPAAVQEFSQVTFSDDTVPPPAVAFSKPALPKPVATKKMDLRKREKKADWKEEHQIKMSLIKS